MENPSLALVIFLSVAVAANADSGSAPWSVKSGDSGSISLSGPCSQIRSEVETLRSWTLSRGESAANLPEIEQHGTTCIAQIEGVLPGFVRQFQGIHPNHGIGIGPNCYNLALQTANIIPGFRYVHGSEFENILTSPLCKKVPLDEPLRPGDIGAIRTKYYPAPLGKNYHPTSPNVHGYIHISDNLIFSKDGTRDDAPVTIEDVNAILGAGWTIPDTSRCRRTNDSPEDSCEHWITYYRCESLETFIQGHISTVTPESLDLLQRTTRSEDEISDAKLGRGTITQERRRQFGAEFAQLRGLIDAAITRTSDPASLLILQNLNDRILSMKIAMGL